MTTTSPTEFEQLCREALQQAGQVSAAAEQRLIADLRLRFHYPGQYVAYRDRYTTSGQLRRLDRRLICHSADLSKVQQAIRQAPSQDRAGIVLEYIEPLGEETDVPHDLPFR